MRITIARLSSLARCCRRRAHAGDARRAAGAAAAALVTIQEIARRAAGRRLALADLRRQLRQPAPQPADADHARQRQRASCRSGRSRPARSATSRRRRCCATTCSTSPGRRTSPGRSTRAPAARSGATAASCPTGPDRVLRPGQPRLRRARRQAVHDHARRAPARARHEDRRRSSGTSTLEDYKIGYASTIAPLVVKDKVIVGVAGGEYGIRGFIDAYDAQTGKRAWRFYTDSRAGRAGQRHLGRRFVEDAAAPASG